MTKKIILFIIITLANPCYAKNDDTLVQIGDFLITEQMLIDDINKNEDLRKKYLLSDSKQLNKYINIYYREKLFEHLALQQKIDQTPVFKNALNEAKRQLLVNLLIEEKKKNIVIPDLTQSAREYYRVNQHQFQMVEQLEARHILLKSTADNPNKESVRQRLNDILIKIKQDPSQFEALAKKYSEDPKSGQKGGLLNKFSKGQMVAEFEREAFQLTEEEPLSKVFSTQYGYHIIQLIKKYPAKMASFEQAKSVIINKLTKEYKEAEYIRWRNKVVDPQRAEINKDKLQKFVQKMVNQSKVTD